MRESTEVVADERIRAWLQPGLTTLARTLQRVGVRPGQLTVVGLVLGLSAAVAAAAGLWLAALVLWLLSRLPDGVDGVLARLTGSASDVGGLFDLMADFLVYGGFVLGVAVALPDARVACAALLLAYYLNGSAFLAIAGLAERRSQLVVEGERSLQFVGGLTEGFETIVAHAVMALLGLVAPHAVPAFVWVFVAMVAVTVLQRLRFGVRTLSDRASSGRGG